MFTGQSWVEKDFCDSNDDCATHYSQCHLKSWRFSSVIECLPSKHKALGLALGLGLSSEKNQKIQKSVSEKKTGQGINLWQEKAHTQTQEALR